MRTLFLLLVAIIFSGCTTSSTETTAGPPNVLLIVIDDLGYNDLAPFGNTDASAPTPNMARLVNSGTAYTQAYVTAPVCSPSRVGMLTGKNQFRWDKPASWGPGLPDSVRTLAEYLREAGYATARIGKNDLGRNFHKKFDKREYPNRHGYDEFLGFNAHAHDYWLHSAAVRDLTPDPSGTSAVLGPLLQNEGEKSYEEGYLTDILTDEALTYLEEKKTGEKPFFLTLAYASVHHLIHEVPQKYLDLYDAAPIPNYSPKDTLSFRHHPSGSYSAYYDKYSRTGAIAPEEMRNYYLANLHCLDDNIGRVLDGLKERGLAEETLIVFVSDNGGSPLTGANNAPLAGGKYSLWEGGIRVPLSVSWPGHLPAGQVIDEYVSTLDVLPTLAEMLDFSLNDSPLDGLHLDQRDAERLLVWKWQKNWAVRRGDYKLTFAEENHWKSAPTTEYIAPVAKDRKLRLFNVVTDPAERQDLAEKMPTIVEELRLAYEEWISANVGVY